MHNTILIVDDKLDQIDSLRQAFVSAGIGESVVSCRSVLEAERLLDGLEAEEFPLAIVSDLNTDEGDQLEDGAKLLEDAMRKARAAGTGVWTVLVSGQPRQLQRQLDRQHDPVVPSRALRKEGDWQQQCASLLAPLFRHELPHDREHVEYVPQGMDPLPAIKDRVFLYADSGCPTSEIIKACPLLTLPVGVQPKSVRQRERPVLMYRGDFHMPESSNTRWTATLLLRWRIVSARGHAKLPVGFVTSNTAPRDLTRKFPQHVDGPSYSNVHSAIGEFLLGLGKTRFSHVCGERSYKGDPLKTPLDDLKPLKSGSLLGDFVGRLHFLLGHEHANLLREWREWLDAHPDESSLTVREKPLSRPSRVYS